MNHDEIGNQPAEPVGASKENLFRSWFSTIFDFITTPKSDMLVTIGVSIAVSVAAFALFWYHLGTPSLWYDELYTVDLSSQTAAIFIKAHQDNMFIYYVFMFSWMHALQALQIAPTAALARIPTAITMVLTVVVLVTIGIRFWSIQVGVVAGMLLGLNGIILDAAQQTRGYSFQAFGVCLSWAALLFALQNPRAKKWWILYVIASLFAIYSILLSVFVVAAQVVGVCCLFLPPISQRLRDFPIIREQGWRAYFKPGAISLATTVILTIPLLLDARKHKESIDWVPVSSPAAVWIVLRNMATQHILAIVALLIALALGVILSIFSRRGVSFLVIAWAVVPVAIQYIVSLPYPNLHFFYFRFLVGPLPGLALLAAIGAAAIPPRWVALGLSLLLLILWEPVPQGYYPYTQKQPFSESVDWMEARYQPGDGVICRPDLKQCGLPLNYYFDFAAPKSLDLPTTFPGSWQWTTQKPVPTDATTLTPYLKGRQRVFVFNVPSIGVNPKTIKDDVPTTLKHAGFKLVATYSYGTKGDDLDVEVQEYVHS